MGIATVELAPPSSMNAAGAHWAKRHRRKRATQGDLAMALLAAGVPHPIPGDRVRATAELLFPTRRRRDEGNFRTALEKALGDALCPHDRESPFRWLSDDTPEHYTFGAVTFGRGVRQPIARVRLVWGEHLAAELEHELEQLRDALNTDPGGTPP